MKLENDYIIVRCFLGLQCAAAMLAPVIPESYLHSCSPWSRSDTLMSPVAIFDTRSLMGRESVQGGMFGYSGDHPPGDVEGHVDFIKSLRQPDVWDVRAHFLPYCRAI